MKTANMSIVRYFDIYGIKLPRFRHKLPFEIIKEIGEKKFNDAFKFLFVRNPYARLVSYFHYQIKQGRQKGCRESKKFIYGLNGVSIPLDFNRYVEFICEKMLPPYALMANYIVYKNKTIINFVGRVEQIKKDIIRLLKTLNLPINNLLKLPHINTTKHKPYQVYYNKTTCDLVYDKYKQDFEVFGYSKKIL